PLAVPPCPVPSSSGSPEPMVQPVTATVPSSATAPRRPRRVESCRGAVASMASSFVRGGPAPPVHLSLPGRCPLIVAPLSWSGDAMSRSCDRGGSGAERGSPPAPPMTKAPVRWTGALRGGRYWDRTSDLFRVREARYRCANRPWRHREVPTEVGTGFEPVYT